jgi:serine/threonine-protein kinase
VIGETIGNFKIVERLGRGGMGEVFLAEQASIGTKVAIKVLRAEVSSDTDHVQRFFNEARAVSKIQHAGIVKIFDVGYAPGGEAYLIMEFLEGETLAKRIADGGPLPLDMLSDFGKQIASVLGATHGAGITHRDLKPDNIYIVGDRELPRGERVKILDFGIAKLTGTLAGASPQTIGTMGTPAYMAPEQWGDASKVDWRADVYSLGCVAFEMATGRPPFIVTTIAEACAMHLHEVPVRAKSIVPTVPNALDELLARLLQKQPEARPQSMQEIARTFELIGEGRGSEIRAVAGSPTRGTMEAAATPIPTSTIPPQTAKKRSKLPFVIAGVVVAGGAGAAAYVAVSGSSAPEKKVAAHPPPPPPPPVAVADAAAAPPPPPDAAVVAEIPADAGAKHPTPPGHHPLDLKAIDDVLATKQADFDKCFAGMRPGNPTVTPSVTFDFMVEPDGFPVEPHATFSTGVHNNCMTAIVGGLKFPNPTGSRQKVERTLALHEPEAPPEPPPRGELKGEITALHGQLAACAQKNDAHGRFLLHLELNADGSVQRAALGKDRQGTPVEPCMVEVLKKAHFPKLPRATTVNFPITIK